MALDPRKRQKQLERRKAKDKAKKQDLRKRTERLEERLLAAIPTAPVLHCLTNQDIFEQGIGHILLSRRLPYGKVAYATFLTDLHCLGVKDAMFDVAEGDVYEERIHRRMLKSLPTMSLEPAAARKLIEGSVDYALDLGFPPHPDYDRARLLFGDLDPATCDRTFAYGKNGKPFFYAGPNDDADRCRRIVQRLHERCGPGGYDFMAMVGAGGPTIGGFPGSFPVGIEDDSDEVDSDDDDSDDDAPVIDGPN